MIKVGVLLNSPIRKVVKSTSIKDLACQAMIFSFSPNTI